MRTCPTGGPPCDRGAPERQAVRGRRGASTRGLTPPGVSRVPALPARLASRSTPQPKCCAVVSRLHEPLVAVPLLTPSIDIARGILGLALSGIALTGASRQHDGAPPAAAEPGLKLPRGPAPSPNQASSSGRDRLRSDGPDQIDHFPVTADGSPLPSGFRGYLLAAFLAEPVDDPTLETVLGWRLADTQHSKEQYVQHQSEDSTRSRRSRPKSQAEARSICPRDVSSTSATARSSSKESDLSLPGAVTALTGIEPAEGAFRCSKSPDVALNRELLLHVLGHRPAHDPPREGVMDRREVQPRFSRSVAH